MDVQELRWRGASPSDEETLSLANAMRWKASHNLEFATENMSQEMAMQGRAHVLGDSSQSHQQTTIDSSREMSINDLLNVLEGANGMPVLLVPSSNGRIVAVPVPVNSLENLVLAEKKQHDSRAWLLLVASLVATVSFSATLTPPGGFWSEETKEHVAGTPIMLDKFPGRYNLFVASNMLAFSSSVVIIGILAGNSNNKSKLVKLARNFYLPSLVAYCLSALGTSFISCMWPYDEINIPACLAFAFALLHVASIYVGGLYESRIQRQQRPPESSA